MLRQDKLLALEKSMLVKALRSEYPNFDKHGYTACEEIKWLAEQNNASVQSLTMNTIEGRDICTD